MKISRRLLVLAVHGALQSPNFRVLQPARPVALLSLSGVCVCVCVWVACALVGQLRGGRKRPKIPQEDESDSAPLLLLQTVAT